MRIFLDIIAGCFLATIKHIGFRQALALVRKRSLALLLVMFGACLLKVSSTHAAILAPELTNKINNTISAKRIKHRIFDAETRLPLDVRPANFLLNELTDSPDLLHQELAFDIVLLQIYRNIVLGKLDKGLNQLNIIEKQQSSLNIFSRQLYLRAIIALKKLEFENVFILLNRMNQLDMGVLDKHHQFAIYLLAAEVYSKANVVEDAIGYSNKALHIANKANNKRLQCRAINSLAAIYYQIANYSQLEASARQVSQLCQDAVYKGELAKAYFFQSLWHAKSQDFEQQQRLLTAAAELYAELEAPLEQAKINLHLANSLMHSERLLDADARLSAALSIITNSSDIEAKTFAYQIKANLLEKMNLLDDAMYYFKQYLTAHKASSMQTKSLNVAYLQRRFESKVSRQARELAKAEALLVSLDIEHTSLKNWVILLAALLVASMLLFLVVFYRRKQTLSMIEQQQRDELTQCFNVDYGLIRANELINDATKHKQGIGVIICNIDNMEAINQNYNYDFGDIFLHSFAVKLSNLRTNKVVTIRMSGDEFMLVCTSIERQTLRDLVCQIHQTLNGISIDNQTVKANLSCGSAIVDDADIPDNPLDILTARAYGALGHAKASGGDCSFCAQDNEYIPVRSCANNLDPSQSS